MNEEIVPTPLDAHFARLMVRLNGTPDPALERAAQAVSAWRAAGHTCMPVDSLGDAKLAGALRKCAVVGAPGEFKPLILDSVGRLYLQRYWAYENELARSVLGRLGDAECNASLLAHGLDRLFPGAKKNDGQRAAAEVAVRKKFAVITGGPGTGKTYTVARALALLIEQLAAAGKTPRIALAAPTGKAAARLQESIAESLGKMPSTEVIQRLPPPAAGTIHRLLGTIPDSPEFRHDREHPLAVDALIVDEASMVDLALMTRLLAAVPPAARVVLLGDKDQLSSVEAGNVLGDICGSELTTNGALREHIVELTTAHRFQGGSGIQDLSQRVNSGDAAGALALLHGEAREDIRLSPLPPARDIGKMLTAPVVAGYRGCLAADDPATALARLNAFRILCALRRGPFGVENLNLVAERILADAGLLRPEGSHYHGRPIVITANDYALRLFNGDVGLIRRDTNAGGELAAFFADGRDGFRRVSPMRLPAHETSFAMTVHKSQGSEFDEIILLLPERDTPLVTRELIYTAITRARRAVQVWAPEALLRAAIERRTMRQSGLLDALWG